MKWRKYEYVVYLSATNLYLNFIRIQIFSIAKLWLLIAASPLGLSVYGKEHRSKFPSSSGKFVRNLSFFINREKQKNSMAELLKGKRMLWSM